MIVRKKKQKQQRKKRKKKNPVWQTQEIKNNKFLSLFYKKCSAQKTSKNSKKFQDEKKRKKERKLGKQNQNYT